MGEVYRARDTRLGRDVAVKVLPQHLRANPEMRARFEREARTISASTTRTSARCSTSGREGGRVDYLVMELIEGETLAERLRKGPLPPAGGAADRGADRRRAGPRAPRGRRSTAT